MVHRLTDRSGGPRALRTGNQGRVVAMILALVALLAGAILGVVWLYSSAHRAQAVRPETAAPQAPVLSESTLAVLRKLGGPVEVRFYSILDPATVPESVLGFAGRVDRLLSAYAEAAEGRMKVTRFDARSRLDPKAAPADGIQVFNLDRGEPCYLGLALTFKGRSETLPRLAPEWEPALEADLTRALVRLQNAVRPATTMAAVPVSASPINTTAVQEVKALIPNLAAVSVEEGMRILREAALEEFKVTAQEMETQVKEAEQRLTQAQSGGSAADQQAAMEHLQQVQARQNQKLKQIAARSKAQVDILQQLKAAR